MSKIITRVLFRTLALETEEKRLLEVEDGSRELAKLQGRVAGRRILIGLIEKQFALVPGAVEREFVTGVRLPDLPDLSDADLAELKAEVDTFSEAKPEEYAVVDDATGETIDPSQKDLGDVVPVPDVDAWGFFLWDLHLQAEETKEFLLRRAERGSDLDFYQAQQRALESTPDLFAQVDNEVKARKARAEEEEERKRNETPDMFTGEAAGGHK